MKNIFLGLLLSAVVGFAPAVQAVTLKEKASVSFKDGDKKKKKKSKQECADKDKKSCCPSSKEGAKKECGMKKTEAQ